MTEMRAELRAHVKTLQALRTTQVEQGHEMRREFADVRSEMRRGFAAVDSRFVGLESEMRDGFTKLGLGMAQIAALLNIAIRKDEAGG